MDHGWVIRRHELSDAEWDFVRLLLPRTSMGRPRLDDRTMLNGIVWKSWAGVAWRDVPERYGSWASLPPVSVAGLRTAPSTGCCRPRRPKRTRRGTSSGWCRSTPALSVSTSMRSVPEKGAPQPGARALQGRADQQNPSGL
nr:transposase [Streptomyces sp. NEAU-Y11]